MVGEPVLKHGQRGQMLCTHRTVVGPVTALAVTPDGKTVFAAIGSTISVFDASTTDGVLRQQLTLFGGGAIIHGIVLCTGEEKVLVHADKQFTVLGLRGGGAASTAGSTHLEIAVEDCGSTPGTLHSLSSRERLDRIICANYLGFGQHADRDNGGGAIALGFFHNFVELWRWKQPMAATDVAAATASGDSGSCGGVVQSAPNTSSGFGNNKMTLVGTCRCPVRCLVYSMDIMAGDERGVCRVASGTIFSDVVLWRADFTNPSGGSGTVLSRLQGHGGVIFKACWSPDGRQVASVSDDRTVRLWQYEDQHQDAAVPPSVPIPLSLIHI